MCYLSLACHDYAGVYEECYLSWSEMVVLDCAAFLYCWGF